MAYSVFVSYSTKDLPTVDRIRSMLERSGIGVFVAEYSVLPGAQLTTAIESAIATCDLFVLLWSRAAQESGWVTSEVAKAQAAGKPIVPVLMQEDVQLPVFLSGVKYLPAHRNPETALTWLQQNVFERAETQQKHQGLVWLGLGAALVWALSE